MRKRIVIAGFGDTGLLVALNLPSHYDIIGISTKPCLLSGQELGTRLARPNEWKKNYLIEFRRFRKLAAIKTLHGTIQNINAPQQTITLTTIEGIKTTLTYDVLVIASGVSNGFWRNNQLAQLDHIERDIQHHAEVMAKAKTIAIVGGGATGVSAASNLKETYPDKNVHLFYSQNQPLPGYHHKVRQFISHYLQQQGVELHSLHRAKAPAITSSQALKAGTIEWQTAQTPFYSDVILWAVGQLQPNNAFIPSDMLNEQGFVKADSFLRIPNYSNIFTVGDIAASDPNRSSARNAGFLNVAHNIQCYLNQQPEKMKAYKASTYRWGSIVGLQANGLRIFTPKGGSILLKPWLVACVLFPLIVRKWIYKGIKSPK